MPTREDGHHVAVLRPVISLHNQLVSSCDQCEAVVVVERLRDVLSERVTGTSGGDTPTTAVIGIGPQQIAHGAFVGHLLNPVQSANVVEGVDAGRKAAVETEDLVLDEGSERKVVEEVSKVLPDIGISVLPKTLVVEAVYLRDLARLVVTAEDGDARRIADLEGYEEGDGLDRVVSSIDVVACEKTIRLTFYHFLTPTVLYPFPAHVLNCLSVHSFQPPRRMYRGVHYATIKDVPMKR